MPPCLTPPLKIALAAFPSRPKRPARQPATDALESRAPSRRRVAIPKHCAGFQPEREERIAASAKADMMVRAGHEKTNAFSTAKAGVARTNPSRRQSPSAIPFQNWASK